MVLPASEGLEPFVSFTKIMTSSPEMYMAEGAPFVYLFREFKAPPPPHSPPPPFPISPSMDSFFIFPTILRVGITFPVLELRKQTQGVKGILKDNLVHEL